MFAGLALLLAIERHSLNAPPRHWVCTTPCVGLGKSCKRFGLCVARLCMTFWQRRAQSLAVKMAGSVRTIFGLRVRRPHEIPWTRQIGCHGCKLNKKQPVKPLLCTIKVRFQNSQCEAQMHCHFCKACAPMKWMWPLAKWFTPRCSTTEAALKVISQSFDSVLIGSWSLQDQLKQRAI